VPEDGFTPRPSPTYDDTTPRPNERPPKPAPSTGPAGGGGPLGPPAAGTDTDTGAGRYSRDRSGEGPSKAPATQTPKDGFDAPITKSPSASTPAPKDTEPFNTEAKKPLVPVQQHGADKKAPVAAPDDAGTPDPAPTKSKTDLKKPSAENREDAQPQKKGPALTLQDRSTWHLSGISRPLFGQIAQSTAPLPERLSSSAGDWAVFSADEAQVVRR
jgi:hypothetical protein